MVATPNNIHVTCSEDPFMYWSNFAYLASLASPCPMHRAFALLIFCVSVTYHAKHDSCGHPEPGSLEHREEISFWCNVDMAIIFVVMAYALSRGYRFFHLTLPLLVAFLLKAPNDSDEYMVAHAGWHLVTAIFMFWIGQSLSPECSVT